MHGAAAGAAQPSAATAASASLSALSSGGSAHAAAQSSAGLAAAESGGAADVPIAASAAHGGATATATAGTAGEAAAAGTGSSAVVAAFLAGLMPKEEIGAQRFLQSHPHADGRGVVVAIFDSGVDPGASGLQVTSDAKPKILDVVDCTGSGDVDMSTVVKADKDGYITAASGARVQVNGAWSNPSGEWRVGSKPLFHVLNESVLDRVKKDRRKKWDAKQQALVTQALRQMAEFDSQKSSNAKDEAGKKEKEELQARLDLLQSMQDSYEDMGPLIDAVVWHDGNTWRAALDTTDLYADANGHTAADADAAAGVTGAVGKEEAGAKPAAVPGRLADFTPMTNYRLERQHAMFSPMDACGFAVNIYDEGRVLSIVTDASAHGTHVAGIVAACHPEAPELNGIAPGAQLVSCKVGDTRLGSMETPQGLIRALIVAQQNKCDVINMSYGEPVAIPNYGRFIDIANQIVHKYGITFVSSAGNDGPALSTVTAPGGTTSSIIGIGAYVSPALAASSHLTLDALPDGQQYTWSSRGPTPDGHEGVCVSAPGGAMSPVPTAHLQSRMVMAGTSMASPNAAGGVALLVSALKQDLGVSKPGPHAIRRALEVTAADLAGDNHAMALTHGRGLVQVDRAFEYLCRHPASSLELTSDIRYSVLVKTASGAGGSRRGIYIREPGESDAPSEWQVFVDPWFHEDADNLTVKAQFERTLKLVPTADWVKAPDLLLLPNNGRNFYVRVDPSSLPAGLHYAELRAIDTANEWQGTLFRVPITVVKPVALPNPAVPHRFPFGMLQPGDVHRTFLVVPQGAAWAEIHLHISSFTVPLTVVIHTLQLVPARRPTYRRTRAFYQFSAPSSKTMSCLVEGGGTLEVSVGLNWFCGRGAEPPPHAELEVEFHGLAPLHGDVTINGGSNVQRIDIASAPFRMERFTPSISLNRLRSTYRPSEARVEPLSSTRDVLPDGRQIQALNLTYKLSISEPGRYTPRFPLLNQRLYDSEVEGQFFQLFDSHRRLLACEDAYPKPVKLPKGELTLKLQIRGDKVARLEKLKAMPLLMDRTLEDKSVLKLSVYNTADSAIFAGTDTVKNALMGPNEKRAFFISGPGDLPKDATPGTLLLGRMTLAKTGGLFVSADTNSAAPCRVHVTYVVPPPSKTDDKKTSSSSSSASPTKTAAERLHEELRDAKVKVLAAVAAEERDRAKSEGEFVGMAQQLKEEYPGHLPLLLEVLRFYDDAKMRPTSLLKVVEAADAVVGSIDRTALAVFLAMKSEPEGADGQKEKKEKEAQRDALIEALHKKALALADLQSPFTAAPATPTSESPAAAAAAAAAAVAEAPALATTEAVSSPADAPFAAAPSAVDPAPPTSAAEGIELDAAAAFTELEAAAAAAAAAAAEASPSGAAAGAAAAAAAGGDGSASTGGGASTIGASTIGASTIGACTGGGGGGGGGDAFEETYQELRKWADVSQAKYGMLGIMRERRANRPALALKILNKVLDDDPKAADKKMQELKVALLQQLQWPLWAVHEKRWNTARFPTHWAPF
ncbi:hypothetical protein CLOM_g1324 [Closterium sp. NIES-68]|nr:hypothetical protein CLOM_g1324 [Closterium sp. NIES-68]GJP66219.1 hypothetical protein CLOP_g23118 [Closterium sp. NIES-67]